MAALRPRQPHRRLVRYSRRAMPGPWPAPGPATAAAKSYHDEFTVGSTSRAVAPGTRWESDSMRVAIGPGRGECWRARRQRAARRAAVAAAAARGRNASHQTASPGCQRESKGWCRACRVKRKRFECHASLGAVALRHIRRDPAWRMPAPGDSLGTRGHCPRPRRHSLGMRWQASVAATGD